MLKQNKMTTQKTVLIPNALLKHKTIHKQKTVLEQKALHKQNKMILIMSAISVLSVILFMTINIDFKYYEYALSIRAPKVIVMIFTAFCIGTASIIFQSIINNTIVTPCLLGINSLYILVHTIVIFVFGSTSIVALNRELSFFINLFVMSLASVVIYSIFFKKTKGNVLYILLTGTVMATFFTSITSTMQRVMDPNEFLSLQSSLYASFSKVNSEILLFAFIVIIGIMIYVRKELLLLDVITMGKDQAINLGIDYDFTVRKLMVAVTLFISVATALVGPISFLGLIIANLSRQAFKTYRHKYLITGACLIGIITLVLGQSLIEHVFHFGINIGVFINIGGGIYFLYLLLRNRS